MDAARTRIGKITLKSGGSVRLLRDAKDDRRAFVEHKIRTVLDSHGDDLAGFAFMVWAPDHRSTCFSSCNDTSDVPKIMIPDFVRNRLMAERIVDWSVSSTLQELGVADKPDPAA